MAKQGVLLINLGTPENETPRAVYRYLREFLNDPRVVDLPWIVRWILINVIVIPLRYKKTTRAYQQIWTDAGSPLLVNSTKLRDAVAASLGDHYHVEIAMRYGNPSIQSAFNKMRYCEDIMAIPLFPQYSSAATGSSIEKLLSVLSEQWNIPGITIQKDFYDHPGFIAAYAENIKKHMADKKSELMIFSYHGLPERHVMKGECLANCNRLDACPAISEKNAHCYRAQCYKTSALLASALHLSPEQYVVAFQSRLGRTSWIKPYTDMLLPDIRKKGVKHIAVVSPSFVADCLETLEEINIRMRTQWLSLGGKEFTFIPSLNAEPQWVQALIDMITKQPK